MAAVVQLLAVPPRFAQAYSSPGNRISEAKMLTRACSQEIDSTVGIMRDNINKVSERGERLDSLQDKTDNLAVSAQGFRRGANKVRKQMWWKDMKMRMCIIIGIIILLIIIVVPAGESPFRWIGSLQCGREAFKRRPTGTLSWKLADMHLQWLRRASRVG